MPPYEELLNIRQCGWIEKRFTGGFPSPIFNAPTPAEMKNILAFINQNLEEGHNLYISLFMRELAVRERWWVAFWQNTAAVVKQPSSNWLSCVGKRLMGTTAHPKVMNSGSWLKNWTKTE